MKQFLDSNQRQYGKRIYLCGPWKDGDHSLIQQRYPHIISYYEEVPYGLCRRLIRSTKKKGIPRGKRLVREVERGMKGVAIESLPPFDEKKYTADTWEYTVYHDEWGRLIHIASFVAYHANREVEAGGSEADREDKYHMLKYAHELYKRILSHELLFRKYDVIKANEYRSCGVASGMYAQSLVQRNHVNQSAIDEASRQMYYCWRKYSRMQPGDKEIAGIVKQKVNPYTGRVIDVS